MNFLADQDVYAVTTRFLRGELTILQTCTELEKNPDKKGRSPISETQTMSRGPYLIPVILAPLRGWECGGDRFPRLATWDRFLRRYAAGNS